MGICPISNMDWAQEILRRLYSPDGKKYFDEALSKNMVAIVDNGIPTSREGYIQNMSRIWEEYDYNNLKYTGQMEDENDDKERIPEGQALALFFVLELLPKTREEELVKKVGSINLVIAIDKSLTIPKPFNEFSYDRRRIFKLNVVFGIKHPEDS